MSIAFGCCPRGVHRRAKIGAALALVTLTACGGSGEDGGATSREPAAAAPARQEVASRAQEAAAVRVRLLEWGIELSRDALAAGPTAFAVVNSGTHRHEFAIVGPGVHREVYVEPGANARLRLELQPGTYEIACSIRKDGIDHRSEGMRAELVVH